MSEIALSIRHLSKQYNGVIVLDDVNLNFYVGEVHGLLGANGAGKSTLCKIISGAIEPTNGDIVVGDEVYSSLTPSLARSAGINMVYQEFNLANDLTVAENLFMGKEIKKGPFVKNKAMYSISQQLFLKLGLDIDCKAKVNELSVAYCQLVEIAKALISESKILILDEPTAPLTKKEVDALFRVINRLKNEGITVIYISHRLEEVFRICDRLSILRDGKLVKTNFTSDMDKHKLTHMMIGRSIEQEFPNHPAEPSLSSNVILKVKSISNSNIKNISLNLKQGEILGLGGLVGSGRSEVVRAISGADPITSGEIIINGRTINIKSPFCAIKNGIGLIPEDRKREGLMLNQSIKLNMTINSIDKISKNIFVDSRKENALINKYIKKLNIKLLDVNQDVSRLSGGNQQKIVLAKWLSTGCEVLIFDEPTRGVDVGAKKEIYELIYELKREGKGVILISSELSEVVNLSDRILVMYNHKIVDELNHDEATEELVLSKASGLLQGEV